MSNGRWGTPSRPLQAVPPQIEPVAVQDLAIQAYQPAPTADGLLGQAKVRLEAIEAELRTKQTLEAERAKLLKMIAALETE